MCNLLEDGDRGFLDCLVFGGVGEDESDASGTSPGGRKALEAVHVRIFLGEGVDGCSNLVKIESSHLFQFLLVKSNNPAGRVGVRL